MLIFLVLNFLDNLAYRKATHESRTYSSEYSPRYAVDGVIAAVDKNDPLVSHTQDKEKQFWMVDLGDRYDIQWIELYNRQNNRKFLFTQQPLLSCAVNIWDVESTINYLPKSTNISLYSFYEQQLL